MLRLKRILAVLMITAVFVACDSTSTDISSTYVDKDDLFKLSMTDSLDFGNLDVTGANKTHSQSVTIKNIGKFAVQLNLPEGNDDIQILSADNFDNPLKPGMSYNFQVNYAPKTFGDKSLNIDMSDYILLPKDNSYVVGPGQAPITSADIKKATFVNNDNKVFDGILRINAKYSEKTSPQLAADTGKVIDFGNLGINNSSVKDIMIENIGDGNAIISNIEVVSSNKIFSIVLPKNFKGHFQPGKTEGFQVAVATGDLIGGASGKLIISSNSIDSPYIIELMVQGKKPDIDFGGSGGQNGGGQVGGTDDNGNELGDGEVSGSIDFESNTIDFGLVTLNKPRLQKIAFKNNNESALAIKDTVISGAGLTVNQAKTTCLNTVLYKGDSCDLFIEFTPSAAQVYSGLVQIQSQIDDGDIFSIDFTTKGEGIEPKLETVNELDFSKVNLGEQKSKEIVIKNTGKDILEISDILLDIDSSSLSEDIFSINSSACVKKLKHNEECKLTIQFKPVEYGEIYGNVTITSNDASSIYNIALSGIGTGSSLSTDNEVNLGSSNKIITYNLEVTNTGYDDIIINNTEFAIKKNFEIKNNACSIISADKTCIMQVKFTPPADGSIVTDVLSITFNENDRYNVIFTGSGAQPKAELSNNDEMIDFGRINVSSEAIYSLYIHNIGNAPLYLSEFTIQNIHGHDEYKISENSCTSEIAPDGMCEIKLTVTPTHGGTINDKLSFKSNELVNNIYNINLTAEAIFSDYALNATSLNFGEKYIYPEQTYNKDVNITNIGTEPITIKNATVINGFFNVVNSCSKLNASESCNINVKVTPNKSGEITDTLRIITDVVTAPIKEVPLRIKGLDRVFDIDSKLLDFGNLTIGSESLSKSLTVTNTGNTSLEIFKITPTVPFSIVNNTCITSLKPDGTCNIAVNVTPINAGAANGTLTIESNALRESTKIVDLQVNGQLESELSINVTELDFGEKYIYPEQTYQKPFTIRNIGTEPFNVSSIVASSPDYELQHSCVKEIAGGDSCSVLVSITPKKAGDLESVITVTTDAAVNPVAEIPLYLNIMDKDFKLNLDTLDFGEVVLNTVSQNKIVTIENTGNIDLAINGITATSPFSIASKTCSAALAPNATCTINVTVTPNSVGAFSGTLSISTDALRESTKKVTLEALGIKPSELSVNITSMDFGEKYVYPEQTYQNTFTITNLGTMPLTITNITSSNPVFKVDSACKKEIAGGASCSGKVSVTPSTAGDINATLTITSNANVNKTKTVSLHIKGLDKNFTVTPASLNFGSVPVGSASTTKAVTIRNTGNVNLAVSSITATSPFSVASKTCGATLTPNATCTVNVKVTPNAAGANTGSLNIITDALRESTKSVALSVTGTTSSYSISTSSLDFGTVEYGQKSAVKTVTVTNTGSLPITFSAPTISSPYSIESNTCNTLQVGGKCTIRVAVTADRVGTIAGTIQIFSDAEINASKTITITNQSFFYSNIAREYKVILSKGKYRIEGAGGKTGDFVEKPGNSYAYLSDIYADGNKIFTADVDSSNTIEYTANSYIELQISVGQGEEGCYYTTPGGYCSDGKSVNAGDGNIRITPM